jgi:hypothetical protein
MRIVEQHWSPDGLLKLVVGCSDDGDMCLGFEGFPWHTHADVLASMSGLSENAAVRKFVDDLVGCRTIIAIARVGGKILDVWVTNEPKPDKYKPDDETIEFRYWDGRSEAPQEH